MISHFKSNKEAEEVFYKLKDEKGGELIHTGSSPLFTLESKKDDEKELLKEDNEDEKDKDKEKGITAYYMQHRNYIQLNFSIDKRIVTEYEQVKWMMDLMKELIKLSL